LRTKGNNRESACREERNQHYGDKSISGAGDDEGKNGHKHQHLAKAVGPKSLRLERLLNELAAGTGRGIRQLSLTPRFSDVRSSVIPICNRFSGFVSDVKTAEVVRNIPGADPLD
jgi:hypothetical protein